MADTFSFDEMMQPTQRGLSDEQMFGPQVQGQTYSFDEMMQQPAGQTFSFDEMMQPARRGMADERAFAPPQQEPDSALGAFWKGLIPLPYRLESE
jgi:hypothetical protein